MVDLVYGFGIFLVGSGLGLLSVCFVGQGSGMQNPKFIQWSRPLSLHINVVEGLVALHDGTPRAPNNYP